MTDPLIRTRIENGISVLEMNAPPANTYSYEMMLQLDAAVLAARMNDAVHVIVLRGAGDRAFSVGVADLASKSTKSLDD